jgi:hypothetical protein|tara:strand:- start:7037 stop:7222 length:186 start_codon:yes stop_codon:yes gene_type:complete
MEMIDWVMENWEQVLMGVSSIVGGFSILATMTPNSADNRVVDAVMRVINFIGANVGKAKNA